MGGQGLGSERGQKAPLQLPQPVYEAVFLSRPNRFGAHVTVDGEPRYVHVPASGRMRELLIPGARCLVQGEGRPGQKTRGALIMVEHGPHWVSVDSHLPNRLMLEAFAYQRVPHFEAYRGVRPEVRYGESRVDFLLTGAEPPALVEVKSVTLVVDGQARFPDAPTDRGRRHLEELTRATREGYRAAVVFVIQRPDARSFAPNAATDPAFAEALATAVSAGVEAHAFTCRVEPGGPSVTLAEEIPVRL